MAACTAGRAATRPMKACNCGQIETSMLTCLAQLTVVNN